MLITDEYRALNQRLHEDRPDYGRSGQRYADIVRQLMDQLQTKDVLDYGAGKRTLEESLGFAIANYDPCVPGIDTTPEPHDLVACTDVLEHLEPDCVDDVLADIRRVTRKVAFLTIATGPAKKYLADGRNAHLIQKGGKWWIPKLLHAGLEIHQFNDLGHELAVVCK